VVDDVVVVGTVVEVPEFASEESGMWFAKTAFRWSATSRETARPRSRFRRLVDPSSYPELMPDGAAADYARAKASGPLGPDELFHDDVPFSTLQRLVERVTAPGVKER